jgi:hypothetical protein
MGISSNGKSIKKWLERFIGKEMILDRQGRLVILQ